MKPTQFPRSRFKRRRTITPAVLCAMLLQGSLCVAGVTYTVGTVGENFAKIQDAIDAATHGDEIIVSPGSYLENIQFNGKNITLRSTNPTDPDVVASTFIDGGTGVSISFLGTEEDSCHLVGFMITSSTDHNIDGAYTSATIQQNLICDSRTALYRCNGTIQNNIISGNRYHGFHFCDGTILNNTVSDNGGDGFYYCNAIIESNTVSMNGTDAIMRCSGSIQNNTISGNGGYGIRSCDGIMQNNTISWNGDAGLGMCVGTIQSNTILQNDWGISNCGGVIQGNIIVANRYHGLHECSATIQNNIIVGNEGSGLFACGGTIRNNTIMHNSSNSPGGGLRACGGLIISCIIWGNHAPDASQLYECSTPHYSCIQYDTAGENGNISKDPRIVGGGDYHLPADSPCIDAGAYIFNLADDFDGDPRGYDGSSEPRGDGSDFDIGADEYVGIAPTSTPTLTPTPTATVTPTVSPGTTPTPTETPQVGPTRRPSDINQDGSVNALDLFLLEKDWHIE